MRTAFSCSFEGSKQKHERTHSQLIRKDTAWHGETSSRRSAIKDCRKATLQCRDRTISGGARPGRSCSLTFDEVGDILEGARLLAVTVDGHGLPRQRLGHKVADNAAVVQGHVRAICVEDAHHTHLLNKQKTSLMAPPTNQLPDLIFGKILLDMHLPPWITSCSLTPWKVYRSRIPAWEAALLLRSGEQPIFLCIFHGPSFIPKGPLQHIVGMDLHLQVVLSLVVKGEALGGALALIIAAALSDGVHIAPVGLRLRVLQWVSIHLAQPSKHLNLPTTIQCIIPVGS